MAQGYLQDHVPFLSRKLVNNYRQVHQPYNNMEVRTRVRYKGMIKKSTWLDCGHSSLIATRKENLHVECIYKSYRRVCSLFIGPTPEEGRRINRYMAPRGAIKVL